MDGNEMLASRIERQLDLIVTSIQRVERWTEAHETKHEKIEETRVEVEGRLVALETSSKTKWALVVSILAVLVSVASDIFGLHLGVR